MTTAAPEGNVRWFGESWGAPVCDDPAAQIPTPTDVTCTRCDGEIAEDDQGIALPFASAPGRPWTDRAGQTKLAWHLDCWMYEIAGDVAVEVLGRRR